VYLVSQKQIAGLSFFRGIVKGSNIKRVLEIKA